MPIKNEKYIMKIKNYFLGFGYWCGNRKISMTRFGCFIVKFFHCLYLFVCLVIFCFLELYFFFLIFNLQFNSQFFYSEAYWFWHNFRVHFDFLIVLNYPLLGNFHHKRNFVYFNWNNLFRNFVNFIYLKEPHLTKITKNSNLRCCFIWIIT